MDDKRQQMFNEYISYLYSTGKSYDRIARYIKSVKDFLDKSDNITRSGYCHYKKLNSYDLVKDRVAAEAIRDFLDFKGIGYMKKKNVIDKPLEKLSVISDKNRKLMNDFIDYMTQEEDYSPNTLRIYSDSVKKFFEYANEITIDNYRRFFKTLEEGGFKPATIRLRMTALERLSKFVKKPISLKRPKFPKKLDTNDIPTEIEYNKLLEYLKTKANKDHYFFVKILGTTGARVSEFLQFTWEDVLSGEVTLKGKGNKYRRFFFSKHLQKEIKEYVKNNSKCGLIAVGRFGPLKQRSLALMMKDWGDKCGIDRKKMHPHAFRHFFAKMFLKRNNDVMQLADILGHGSINTTRIYLQKSYEEQKTEFNRSVTW